MRDTHFEIGEAYYVFNRGNNDELIFLDERDRIRFLFLLLHLQSPETLNHISSYIDYFKKHKRFNISGKIALKIKGNRNIELLAFSIMPNCFHLILRELKPGGISRFMHRILVSYSKYFNNKYRKVGHLLQGTFKCAYIESEGDLEHLSAYIHKSPRELPEWRSRVHLYPWSSYQDFLSENRFIPFLSPEEAKKRFKSAGEYKTFVDSSKLSDIEHLLSKTVGNI